MSISIRDISAKPGEKKQGFIEVAETASTVVKVPIAIVNGIEPGPKLCLTAGIHCTEYEGIEAVTRVYREIDPAKLKGALVICFVINTPGFQYGTHYVNPLDNKNMNRMYPGDPEGSISERMCHVILNELIRKCDYFIDAHGGEPVEDLIQFVIYATDVSTPEIEAKTAEMARYYLPNYIFSFSGGEGNSSSEVGRVGIPAITPEAGSLAAYREEDTLFHYRGIKNVMKWLRMLPKEGPPEEPKNDITYFTRAAYAKVNHGGIFFPRLHAGDEVKKGEVMAEIKDLFGDVIEQIFSPVSGVVVCIFPKRVKISGDNAYQIWINE